MVMIHDQGYRRFASHDHRWLATDVAQAIVVCLHY